MHQEIERKFFFDPRVWKNPVDSTPIEQGYLADTGSWEIRLRRTPGQVKYTMKSLGVLDRDEWEVPLSADDADQLWPRTEGLRLRKIRDRHLWKGLTVEVDRYQDNLEGLNVAEVEFSDLAAARKFPRPKGFGPELTYDPRFRNRALAAGSGVPLVPPGKDTAGWSFGVIPYRKTPLGWQLVIVTTRRQDRWIFPKGQPEPGMTWEKVAQIEAREEAGAVGRVDGSAIVLPYARETGTTNLLLFPLLVTSLTDKWLEQGQRERKLIPLEQAERYGELVNLGAQYLRDKLES